MTTRRRWTLMIAGCLTLIAIVLIALLLSLQWIPTWYAPAFIDPGDAPRIRRAFLRRQQSVTDGLVRHKPFDIVLTAAELNEWIAARRAIWPDADFDIPPWIQAPAIAFEDDRIVLAARFRRGDWQAILAARLSVDVDVDAVTLRLDRITAGAVTVPRDRAANLVNERFIPLLANADALPEEVRDFLHAYESRDASAALYAPYPIENRFIWPNGKQSFRVTGVRAKNGVLTISILPTSAPRASRGFGTSQRLAVQDSPSP